MLDINIFTHTNEDITDWQCLYGRVCNEGQVLQFRRKYLFRSLYDSCDSWPGSHHPSCVFAPLPIQHYPKPRALAAQHNHGELPTVDAESAFQRVNSQLPSEFTAKREGFPHSSQDTIKLCDTADTLKAKIDFFFPPTLPIYRQTG